MSFLQKEEIKYILFAGGFAVLWFFLILPFLIENLNGSVFLQFLLFNIGLTILLLFVLKSFALGQGIPVREAIGLLVLIVAVDLWLPPYMLSFKGELLTGPLVSQSAADYFVGYLGQLIGIPGFLLFAFTYVLVPILLLFLSAKLLRNFVRKI